MRLTKEAPNHPWGRRAIPRPFPYSIDVDRKVSLTAVYESVENGWIQARIREMPGVITAAPTREEAQEDLLDALREFLLSFGQDVDGNPDDDSSNTQRLQIVLSA
jgi:predicted RNase H-like HicB family nuclease